MADEEGAAEKKDKPKEDEKKDKEKPEEKKDKEKPEEGKEDATKTSDTARHNSPLKKRTPSKALTNSKSSLRKPGESLTSFMSSSSGSFIIKRPSSIEKMAKGPRYQNTYRLDSKKPFKAHEVYKILEAIVLREVDGLLHYDWSNGQRMVQTIAVEARNAIKQMNYDRYKICVLVYVGEKKLQGLQAAFRALWDPERDGWSTFFFQCRTYFISCTCFAIYHD